MEVSGMKSGKSILSALSVILAGILWGVINLFIRALSAGGLGALEISLLRTAGAALLFLLVVGILPSKREVNVYGYPQIPRREWLKTRPNGKNDSAENGSEPSDAFPKKF